MDKAGRISGSLDEGRITFESQPQTVRDPVCGMDIRPDRAVAASDRGGQRYYFCSDICKQQFDAHPERFSGLPAQATTDR